MTLIALTWWLVAIVGALLIAYCYRHRKRMNIALARIWPSPGLTLIFAGAVILFAYSILVGHEPLWQAMLGEHYARVVKLAVEEFIELIGYLLLSHIVFLYKGIETFSFFHRIQIISLNILNNGQFQ